MVLKYAFDEILRVNFMEISRVKIMLAKLWWAEFIFFLRFEFMFAEFLRFKFALAPNSWGLNFCIFNSHSRRICPRNSQIFCVLNFLWLKFALHFFPRNLHSKGFENAC